MNTNDFFAIWLTVTAIFSIPLILLPALFLVLCGAVSLETAAPIFGGLFVASWVISYRVFSEVLEDE